MSTRTVAMLLALAVVFSAAILFYSLTVEVGDGNPVALLLPG